MWCNDLMKLASIAGYTGTSLKALGRVATHSRGSVSTEVLGAVHRVPGPSLCPEGDRSRGKRDFVGWVQELLWPHATETVSWKNAADIAARASQNITAFRETSNHGSRLAVSPGGGAAYSSG